MAKHHIFIDANVYLRFDKLSDADVKELDQIVTLVKSKEVKLYLTEQVRDEFWRNREEAIAESLKGIREQALRPNFPRMFRDQEGFADLRKAVTAYEDKRTEMLDAVVAAAEAKELAADKLITELFNLAEFIPLTGELWETAKRRYDLRNPPGKGKSYGDAVHWVSLLEAVPNGSDLSIVSTDRDFASDLDGTRISDFLREEWRGQKEADVALYPSLPDMVRDLYPDMKLLQALEEEMAERALAVNALVGATKFAETHDAIAVVAQYSDFLPSEVERLLMRRSQTPRFGGSSKTTMCSSSTRGWHTSTKT